MRIIDVETGKSITADIVLMESADFKTISRRNNQFGQFNWNNCLGKEVYKCIEYPGKRILGLMCLTEHSDPATNAMEIELLEVSEDNIGKKKKISGIAACLIAFACRESFKRGHDGFTFLTPKTNLIEHYRNLYGMMYLDPIGANLVGLMIIDERLARKLIKQYLE